MDAKSRACIMTGNFEESKAYMLIDQVKQNFQEGCYF
jgi:hypothetical protein